MVIALGDYMSVKCHACIGGTSVQVGISKLKEGQHIIVGTPGRVYDMLNRGTLGKCMYHCRVSLDSLLTSLDR